MLEENFSNGEGYKIIKTFQKIGNEFNLKIN